jgi:hypothetical protein
VRSFFDAAASGLPGPAAEKFDRAFRREAGFGLSDLGAVGDVALFAEGASLADLLVGGVIEFPAGPKRTQLLTAIRKLVKQEADAVLLPLGVEADEGFAFQPAGIPVPINVAARGDLVAIAGADEATETLLSGDGGLASSEVFESASDALGDGFGLNVMLQFEPIQKLIEATAADDPDFEEAKPYLEALGVLAGGTKSEGDRDLNRIVLELR